MHTCVFSTYILHTVAPSTALRLRIYPSSSDTMMRPPCPSFSVIGFASSDLRVSCYSIWVPTRTLPMHSTRPHRLCAVGRRANCQQYAHAANESRHTPDSLVTYRYGHRHTHTHTHTHTLPHPNTARVYAWACHTRTPTLRKSAPLCMYNLLSGVRCMKCTVFEWRMRPCLYLASVPACSGMSRAYVCM